jgi:hypothetical protein
MVEIDAEADSAELELVGAESTNETLPGTVYYHVHCVVRGRHNRTARFTQVGRRALVQKFAGGTVLVRRGKPARLTEAALIANLPELKQAVSEHRVNVTTLTGQAVDLGTFEAAPLPATKPLPNPPLDSAKNDKNEGVGYDVPPNPSGTPFFNTPVPELLQRGSPLESEEADESVEVEEVPETVVEEVEPPTVPMPATAPAPVTSPLPALVTAQKRSKGKGRR